MKLETNRKASSGKQTWHFNIKSFLITNLIAQNEVSLQYCPTEFMIADYMTKPLVRKKFIKCRWFVMNLPNQIKMLSTSVLGKE